MSEPYAVITLTMYDRYKGIEKELNEEKNGRKKDQRYYLGVISHIIRAVSVGHHTRGINQPPAREDVEATIVRLNETPNFPYILKHDGRTLTIFNKTN